jgi:leader peptidase (prepilin peptidase)/N-methyltransferase
MLEAILALLAGLLIGSFLNVCIYRMPRDLSVVRPRSYCPACGKPIAWYDNIPLASYVILRGRCRHCGGRIPLRYPVVELLTGTLFVLAVLPMGVGLPALKWCLFGALMTGLLFSDLEQRILPDEFTLGGAAAGIMLAAVVPMDWGYAHLLVPGNWDERWVSVGESVLGAAFSAGLMWVIGSLYAAVRHKEGLGLGDVKMLAMIGAFLGLHGALQVLILGSVAGSVTGLVYIRLTHKNYSTYELPFGTFLGVTGLLLGFLRGPLSAWIGRGGG